MCPKEKKFHKRSFISLLTALSFLAITVTGIVLYIVPAGRVAYWTAWKFLGLTKTDWTNLHIVSCFLFLVSCIFHIYYNWNALMNYLFSKAATAFTLKREFVVSVIILGFVLLSGKYLIPPLGYLIDISEYIKKSWVKSPEYEPPFGHAEELSLKVFAKKMNIDLQQAIEELKKKGIVVENETDSLKKIAQRNKTSPMNLYLAIKHLEQRDKQADIVYTPELVEEKFAGTGIGRKTLSQVCAENNIDLTFAKKKLSEKGIIAKDEETLKEIASRHDKQPIDILKIILVDENKIRNN
ncbi:MAG: DUF4405 domain-containing protein [Caldimicrobium sp.]